MFEIKGKYATALVTTYNIEEEAIGQVTELVNDVAAEGSKVVIMPDVHAGKGSVVGTVMQLKDRVVPNLVGVDIGCGVLAVEILNRDLDYESLDRTIKEKIPFGFGVHNTESKLAKTIIKDLRMHLSAKDRSHILKSLGSLGGGNHFISVEQEGDTNFLCIHSGSRSLGLKVAKHYQEIAISKQQQIDYNLIIQELKDKGQQHLIEGALKDAKAAAPSHNKDLAYLTGEDMDNYIHDLKIAQKFAYENRLTMAKIIIDAMGWTPFTDIHTIHNYIDTKTMILRKGAVAATVDEHFIVPLNMKDGSLICVGRPNDEWLQSAPHGAGRAMSRRKAKELLNVNDFIDEMKEVWSSSIGESTLDEAPSAYKPAQEIKDILSKKYKVVAHLKPVYNFKA